MADRAPSTRKLRVHARDKDFTLYVRPRGHFTLLAPAGRYTESLLGILAQDFLSKPAFLGVDLSGLDAVTLPLVKALHDFAVGLDPAQGRLVFINPPGKIRALLALVDKESRVPVALADTDLEGPLEEVEARVRRGVERLQLVRTMLASHPCWQLTDREGRWLCPFCVTIRADVRFIARGTPSQAVVGRVLQHLSGPCSTYQDGATDGWPFEVLERVLRAGQGDGEAEVADAPLTMGAARAPGAGRDRRRRLLPRTVPPMHGFDVELYTRAASPLSGDFYDFIRLPDGRRAIVVGDVSGGDVEPAVLMATARKTLSLRLRETPHVSQALARVNDDLCDELDQESYVSAVVAVLDGDRRELWLARAGHPAPFLLRSGRPSSPERLEPPGPVLGFVPTASFEQGIELRRFSLQPGDVLLLHTDGLEDLQDAARERFGPDRIADVLRSNASADVTMILGALVLEAEQFAGSGARPEDMTAVCVKVR